MIITKNFSTYSKATTNVLKIYFFEISYLTKKGAVYYAIYVTRWIKALKFETHSQQTPRLNNRIHHTSIVTYLKFNCLKSSPSRFPLRWKSFSRLLPTELSFRGWHLKAAVPVSPANITPYRARMEPLTCYKVAFSFQRNNNGALMDGASSRKWKLKCSASFMEITLIKIVGLLATP